MKRQGGQKCPGGGLENFGMEGGRSSWGGQPLYGGRVPSHPPNIGQPWDPPQLHKEGDTLLTNTSTNTQGYFHYFYFAPYCNFVVTYSKEAQYGIL